MKRTSLPQISRTRPRRRLTVRREQFSRSTISSLVYPSSLAIAVWRSDPSPNAASRRSHSSATSAAKSGVGSRPTSFSRAALPSPWPAPPSADSPHSLPTHRREPVRASTGSPIHPSHATPLARSACWRGGHRKPQDSRNARHKLPGGNRAGKRAARPGLD